MKIMRKIVWLQILIGGLSGCSDIKDDITSTLTKFNGIWEVSGGTDAKAAAGKSCGYGIGRGTLTITGTRVAGEATDNSGYSYAIEARIEESGKIAGGFTYEGYDAATFGGTLSGSQGGGTFKDINGCPGTWQVTRGTGEPARVAAGS